MAFDPADCAKLPRRLRKICEGDTTVPEATREKYLAAWNKSGLPRRFVKRKPTLTASTAAPRPAKQTSVANVPCFARGLVIRQDTGNLCGTRGKSIDIYKCEKFGECSLGKYCQQQTVRTCAGCIFDGEHVPNPDPPKVLTATLTCESPEWAGVVKLHEQRGSWVGKNDLPEALDPLMLNRVDGEWRLIVTMRHDLSWSYAGTLESRWPFRLTFEPIDLRAWCWPYGGNILTVEITE